MLKKSCLYELRNTFDFFGMEISFKYDFRKKYKSPFSLVSSILVFFSFFIVLIIYTINELRHSNFKETTSLTKNLESIINFSNIPFMFRFQTGHGDIIEENSNLFSIDIVFLNSTLDNNHNRLVDFIFINKETCNISKHFYGYEKYFKNLNVSQFKCFVPNQKVYLKGRGYDELNSNYQIYFYINKCTNNSFYNNVTCLDEDTIQQTLENGNFIFYYLENTPDNNIYKDPIKKSIRASSVSFTNIFYKKHIFKFSNSKYINDVGLFYEKNKIYHFIEQKEYNLDIEKESDNFENSIGYVNFQSYTIDTTYKRYYTKIPEIIAYIGGTMNLIIVIFKFLTDFFAHRVFLIDLLNVLIDKKNNMNNKDGITNNFHYKKNISGLSNIFKLNDLNNANIINNINNSNINNENLDCFNNENNNKSSFIGLNNNNLDCNNDINFSINNINNPNITFGCNNNIKNSILKNEEKSDINNKNKKFTIINSSNKNNLNNINNHFKLTFLKHMINENKDNKSDILNFKENNNHKRKKIEKIKLKFYYYFIPFSCIKKINKNLNQLVYSVDYYLNIENVIPILIRSEYCSNKVINNEFSYIKEFKEDNHEENSKIYN